MESKTAIYSYVFKGDLDHELAEESFKWYLYKDHLMPCVILGQFIEYVGPLREYKRLVRVYGSK